MANELGCEFTLVHGGEVPVHGTGRRGTQAKLRRAITIAPYVDSARKCPGHPRNNPTKVPGSIPGTGRQRERESRASPLPPLQTFLSLSSVCGGEGLARSRAARKVRDTRVLWPGEVGRLAAN
jgi:hypothetical protein